MLRILFLIASIFLISGKTSHAEEITKCPSVEICLKLAEEGDARAQYELGVIYREGEEWGDKEGKEALEWIRKAADQGHIDAQAYLGTLYYNEAGGRDYEEAILWFRRAAEQGHAESQFNLATMYYNGEGTARDLEQAKKLYRKAAEQGHSLAIERSDQLP